MYVKLSANNLCIDFDLPLKKFDETLFVEKPWKISVNRQKIEGVKYSTNSFYICIKQDFRVRLALPDSSGS